MKKETKTTAPLTSALSPEQGLRREAEKLVLEKAPLENTDTMSPAEVKQTLHELQVHQVELEMQNEELRRAHKALDVSHARSLDLYDFAPVGYITLSEQGLILEANLTAATLMGLARSALVKQPITRFILKEDQDIYYLHRQRLFETAEPQVCEMRMVKGDNSIFWGYLTATVAHDDDGVSVCRIVLTNITEQKQAEIQKTKLEELYRQAQKMESVGRLAGGIAHDYNNALSVIMGFTELAMDEVDPASSLYANLKETLAAARHAAEINRQLLTFSCKQTIAPKVADLNESIGTMLKMLRSLIGEDIDLTWLPGAKLKTIKIDPSQSQQILANLCVNARDAITGVGKITIKTDMVVFDDNYCADHPGSTPGEYVMLFVGDNGCGMDNATLKTIFEPFFTTKTLDKGSGLGLSMVYGIVKQNNGFIDVDSEPGMGTSFKIYLPSYGVDAIKLKPKNIEEKPQGQGETILIVEDELSILKLTGIILKRLGYVVLKAGSPEQAMELLKGDTGSIHLLLTDVIMPGMNGLELSKRVQSLYPELKCIFMSGYTSNVLTHQGVLDEGMHFIQKPFAAAVLAKTVRGVLDGAKGCTG